MTRKRIVQIESPFSPSNGRTVEENIEYARAAMWAVLMQGDVPYASHLLYTQPGVLDDTIPEQREMGIQAGFELYRQKKVDVCAIYSELGITKGMIQGIMCAMANGIPLEFRSLDFLGPEYHSAVAENVFDLISKS